MNDLRVWIIRDIHTEKNVDVALNFTEARIKAVAMSPDPHEDIYIALNSKGNFATYSQDGEKTFFEIVQCRAEEVVTRHAETDFHF